jgi:DNA-binding CsgD family transcriptional regulator/tetratricopeptide (TPR) repeat protein
VPLTALHQKHGEAPLAFDAWLDELCEQRPVVLVVDDIQWADQSTLDVLLFVLAGPEQRRLSVLLTVRHGEEGPLLSGWLPNVRRLPRVQELHVQRLDRVGVQEHLAALLGRSPRQSLVDQVHTRAGGNPYLTELLVLGLNADASSVPAGMPTELRDAVTRIWHHLTPNARALTHLMAVNAHPDKGESLMLLAHQTGIVSADLSLLREVVDAGVVEARSDGTYWFTHPLLPEVLQQDLLREEKQAVHAAIAEAIHSAHSDEDTLDVDTAVALADHHAGAGHHQEAFHWALIASESVARSGGAAEALRLLNRAVGLWPGPSAARLTKVELLLRVQVAAERCGDLGAEMNTILELLELVDAAAEPILTCQLLLRTIDLEYEMSVKPTNPDAAARQAVLLSSTHPDSPEYAIAMARLAGQELWEDLPSGPRRAEEAVVLAKRTGSPKALAHALVSRVIARVFAGEPDALDDALAAEAAALEAGDFLVYVSAVAQATNCIDIGTTNPKVEEHLAERREQLVALAAPHRFVAMLCAMEAYNLFMRGEWRECESRLRVAMGSTPGPRADGIARLTAALLDTRHGRWRQAEEHLARAVETPGSNYEFFGYHAIRAELAIARGDNRTGFDTAMAGVNFTHANLIEHLLPLAARALANQARALRDRGQDPEPALAAMRELQTEYPKILAEVGPGPAHAAEVKAMQAVYEAEVARASSPSGASASWQRAAEASAEAALAWDEAYCWWRAADAGFASTATGATAKTCLQRAHRLAAELAATPLLDEIAALAQEARVNLAPGETAQPHSSTTLPQLSPREQQILDLVVAGRTYAEIAGELFISEKTVSSHISNMLRKTDTSSRIELAQLARRISVTPREEVV